MINIALISSGETPICSSALTVLFALTPTSIKIPPFDVPMYMQLPLLDENSGQNLAIKSSLLKRIPRKAGFFCFYIKLLLKARQARER